MRKNVLIISSSPRKGGNSETLAASFAKGAQDAGNHVETVWLREKQIGFCKGCLACLKAGHCVIKDDAAEIAAKYRVHGCTDVTGFGFLGHLHEMMRGAYSCQITASAVPYIADARRCADEFLLTAAGQRNRNYVEPHVDFGGIDFAMEEILLDPQTSGGLLISVDPEDAEALLDELKTLSLPCGMVGEVINRRDKEILVRP